MVGNPNKSVVFFCHMPTVPVHVHVRIGAYAAFFHEVIALCR